MQKIYKHSRIRLVSPKYLLTWALFVILWLIGQLSHRFAIKAGNLIGSLLYPLFPKRTYIIKTNLALCFRDKTDHEIDSLARQNFNALIVGAFETAIAWYASNRTFSKMNSSFSIENEHILQEYINKDKPLLLVAPHCVSQELVSRYLVKKYNYIPVFRHLNNPVANYIMQKARLKIYNDVIIKSNPHRIIKLLKEQKAPIALLPDQDFGRKRSVFAHFFNIPTATTTSLSKYKKLTDCNIVPVSYSRKINTSDGCFEKFIIKIHPPLMITGQDQVNDATIFNHVLEEIIKKDISAYFWIAKKFKTRPLGEEKIYNYRSKINSSVKN